MDFKEKCLANVVESTRKMVEARLEAGYRERWRNTSVFAAHESGASAIEIADAAGLTRQQVHRILSAYPDTPEIDSTSVNIQYKGTDICIDVYCKCGVEGHFDGFHANNIKCPSCGEVFGLPFDPAPLPPHEGYSTVTFVADGDDGATVAEWSTNGVSLG